jgi:hypothetical protein
MFLLQLHTDVPFLVHVHVELSLLQLHTDRLSLLQVHTDKLSELHLCGTQCQVLARVAQWPATLRAQTPTIANSVPPPDLLITSIEPSAVGSKFLCQSNV